jgi:hypothetical protein
VFRARRDLRAISRRDECESHEIDGALMTR